MIKITLLCTDINHPIYFHLEQWSLKHALKYDITLMSSMSEINRVGDILFLVSCSEIVEENVRKFFKYVLVLHASNLPEGRGWSPHIWEIIEGKSELTISLLEANDKVDTGNIWKKINLQLQGDELYDEINEKLFHVELDLIGWACENYSVCQPQKQSKKTAGYYRKRTPEDSELDISKSIAEQFNLMRVCDPKRFPAFFIKDGRKYKMTIERME